MGLATLVAELVFGHCIANESHERALTLTVSARAPPPVNR